jgi:ABC-type proline/glycine betaine transport system substrate-binding protein
MDWIVNVEKKTPREVAQTWMKSNEGRVSEWFRT